MLTTDLMRAPSPQPAPFRPEGVDVAIAVVALGARAGSSAWRRGSALVAPVTRVIARPPGLPERWSPSHLGRVLGAQGALARTESVRTLGLLLDRLVPLVVEQVVSRLDLTALVSRHVDLDEVVTHVDLDAAVERVHIDRIVERLDLDAIAARIDVDAVARRLDIQAVLDQLDLTAVVLERVDLETLVDAVLAKVDLVGLANEVIEAIDLPDMIRDSSGALASETVRGARMRGIAADQALTRMRDRMLHRRHQPPADAAGADVPTAADAFSVDGAQPATQPAADPAAGPGPASRP